MTENLSRERYLAAWEQERRLDDEAWLRTVRRLYPTTEEARRLRRAPVVHAHPRWQFLYRDHGALD